MRILLTSPLPRAYVLICKLLSGALVSLFQVYAFLLIARAFEVTPPAVGYLAVLPATLLAALMLGALGLLLASLIKQLENFAGVMNFVVFPMFFLSSALYPLWKMRESNELIYYICAYNPFTHAVELIRYALYGQFNAQAFWITAVSCLVFTGCAIVGYDPGRGIVRQKGKPGGP